MAETAWVLLGVGLDVVLLGLALVFAATALGAAARYRERRFALVGLSGLLLAGAAAADLGATGIAPASGPAVVAVDLVRGLLVAAVVALLLGVTLRRAPVPAAPGP